MEPLFEGLGIVACRPSCLGTLSRALFGAATKTT
jgi:hypothetical protein